MFGKKRIGEVVIEKGWVSRQKVEEILAQQAQIPAGRQALGDILVSLGLISEKQKAEALAISLGQPFIDLAALEVTGDFMKTVQELLHTVKPEACRRLKVVPFERIENRIRVAMHNPLDVFAQDELRMSLGREVVLEFLAATEEDIFNLLNQALQAPGGDSDVSELLSTIGDEADDTSIEKTKEENEDSIDVGDLQRMTDQAPVIKLSHAIIIKAVQAGASDIHIQPYKDRTVVRLRVDGVLREVMTVPRQYAAALVSRLKLMAELDIANRLTPQDGRIGLTISGRPFDFRVSSLPGVLGEKIVMRILDKQSTQVGLEKLGISTDTRERFERMFTSTYGIILITGPTGSGKSTTLYSVLSRINAPEKNIVTVEDPVEYQLPGLTQVNVNVDANLTFAAALKAFLRQDPNVIMVGEIRDLEVGKIAIEAALTGHLVLSTLHTNDAPTAITRLAEMGIEPFLISSAVLGVLAQRLVRRICPKCKEEYVPDVEATRRAGFALTGDERLTFYRGRGCDACGQTGYKGRLGIYELFAMSDTLRDLVTRGATAYEIKMQARKEGMRTLQEDAMDKIKLGMTTVEEALRVIASVG